LFKVKCEFFKSLKAKEPPHAMEFIKFMGYGASNVEATSVPMLARRWAA